MRSSFDNDPSPLRIIALYLLLSSAILAKSRWSFLVSILIIDQRYSGRILLIVCTIPALYFFSLLQCSFTYKNTKNITKREYCHEQKQYKKQMIIKWKMLQRIFTNICSNRFSAKIWRNVIFLKTFINYFK